MAGWLIEVLCILNCITAFAFNFGVMQLGDTGFSPSTSQSLTIRQGISLDLAKSRDCRPAGLTPSNEEHSRMVFDKMIINNDFKKTQIKDTIDKDFSVPNQPIFFVDYEGKDERFIADQIVKHRIVPIMRRAKVQPSDYFEMCFL
jgi:hypothetical protein